METPHNGIYLTGKEGEEWDLKLAASWTKNHREKHPELAVSHFYGKEILQKILAQEGCMGIRFYHAYDHNGNKHLILAGATADGQDMLNTTAADGLDAHILGQAGQTCPGQPGCPGNLLSGS
jgi:hypothetical protein